jgi:hypothetical protein
MENTEKLKLLNQFTRRELTEEEVYIFDVILCDNEIDRDFEKFSLSALKTLQELFIGKTGIFDHDAKSSGQTARIFHTELAEDSERKTSTGENYVCLKGCAYMVRTSANENLIKEIEGGIKKEVSISCSASVQKCSVCGANKRTKNCPHTKGKEYAGKTKLRMPMNGALSLFPHKKMRELHVNFILKAIIPKAILIMRLHRSFLKI